jgi:hypothetical protein
MAQTPALPGDTANSPLNAADAVKLPPLPAGPELPANITANLGALSQNGEAPVAAEYPAAPEVSSNENLAAELIQRAGGSNSLPDPSNNIAPPTPLVEIAAEKKAREKNRTWVDTAASVVRQDSPIPGLIAHFFGPEMVPVPGYSPFANPEEWKKLTEGISPEYLKEFYNSSSPAMSEHIRERLIQKQGDLVNLGDMGMTGQIGRFAYGMTEPAALLAGLASGGVGYGMKAGLLTKTAVGSLAGGATMGAVEKLRQSVNFEHDDGRVLETALMATAMTAPFAYLGARGAARVASAAALEKEALEAARKLKNGEGISIQEQATLLKAQEQANLMADVENGKRPPEDLEALYKRVEDNRAESRLKYLESEKAKEANLEALQKVRKAREEQAIKDVFGAQETGLPLTPEQRANLEAYLADTGPIGEPNSKEAIEKAFSTPVKDKGVAAYEAREAAANAKRTEVEKAWKQHEAQHTDLYQKQLDQLQRDGMLTKGKEEQVLAEETPTAMELAFRNAVKKGKGSTIELPSDAPKKPQPASELVGDHVFWHSDEGPGIDHGRVIGENARGKLIVEHNGEQHLIDRADLHPDSPGFHYDGDGLPNVLKKGQVTTEFDRKLVTDIQGGHGAADVIETIINNSTNMAYRSLARMIRAAGLKTSIKITPGTKFAASYHPGSDTIHIHTQGGAEANVLHEMIHAATHKALKAGGEVAKKMEALYAHVKASGKAGDQYGLTNVDEFVAEAMSNPDFQKVLRTIEKMPGDNKLKNAWDKLVDIVRGLLGKDAKVKPDVLSEVMATGRQLMGGDMAHATPQSTWNTYIPGIDKLGMKIPVRMSLFAKLDRSSNVKLQEAGSMLIKDEIGPKNGGTQRRSVEEDKALMKRIWRGQAGKERHEAFQGVIEKRKIAWNDRAKAEAEFNQNITNLIEGDGSILVDNKDIAPELQKAAKAYQDLFEKQLNEAIRTGVQGAEQVKANRNYVSHQWMATKIRSLMATHGEDHVYNLVAHSFKHSDLYGNLSKAESFVKTILKLQHSTKLQNIAFGSRDLAGLRAELSAVDPATGKAVLDAKDIDNLIDVYFEKVKTSKEGDAGNAPQLKYRMDLDANYKQKMPNGETVSVADLMERDIQAIADRYTNSMTGRIALAKRGIKSDADFERLVIQPIIEHQVENGKTIADGGKFDGDLKWVRDIYSHIVGRPMSNQVFNVTSRVTAALQAYSRSTVLGELGLTAAGEVKQVVALSSLRAVTLQSPEFANLLRSLKNGRVVDKQLARDVEMMVGHGHELQANHTRGTEMSDYVNDPGLTAAENAANNLAHIVDRFSGNAFVTSLSRQHAAMSFIQHHVDLASGVAELTASKRVRLAHQGIEADSLDEVFSHLKQYAELDGTNGRVESIEWERWQQENPKTYEQYQTALDRETRDGIQDHSLGETLPFGHTQLGKIMLDLKTFSTVAHGKNFLKNLSYMDRTTFNVHMYNTVGEAMMYAIQTSINYAHDPEELRKRLSLPRIASAVVQRSAALGMTFPAINTAYWMGSGGHDFSTDVFGAPVSTANTDNRNFIVPPTVNMLTKAFNATKTVGGVVNPWSTAITTKREAKDAFSLLPGANLYGMRNLNDYISSTFPKHELKQILP